MSPAQRYSAARMRVSEAQSKVEHLARSLITQEAKTGLRDPRTMSDLARAQESLRSAKQNLDAVQEETNLV